LIVVAANKLVEPAAREAKHPALKERAMLIKDLIDGRNQIASDMRALHETAETEGVAFTPEQRTAWDAMDADLVSFDSRIETATRAQDIGDDDIGMPVFKLPTQASDPAIVAADPDAQPKGPDHRSAWNSWARRGVAGCSAAEQSILMEHRAQSLGTDSEGGFTVPEEMSTRVVEAMKKYGGIVNVCNVLNTSTGAVINFPGNDDTGNIGALVAENITATEQDTVFTNTPLGAYKFSSKMIRVSRELLNDNEVNLESYLVNILAKRLGRIESQYFATGSGTAQPQGLMTGATITHTAAANDAVTYADILALEHSVDPAYRETVGTFVFNDQTLRSLKSLIDLDGRPLWLPGLTGTMAVSEPSTILGHGYQIDQGVADIATTARTIAFGDMQAFTVRRTLGVDMMRLEERYAEFFQVAFLGWTRADSALLDTDAVAVLVQA
jgi:HK97 family phage major capsid protein